MDNGKWYWPDVSNIAGAKDAANTGRNCAIVVAVVTSLFAVGSLFGIRSIGITPTAFVDVALFAAIAYGLHRHSRFAAVAGLLLFVVEKIYTAISTGNIVVGVGLLGIPLLLGFVNGVRGALAYHKLMATTPATQTLRPGAAPEQP